VSAQPLANTTSAVMPAMPIFTAIICDHKSRCSSMNGSCT
jgi:hypothetical protein